MPPVYLEPNLGDENFLVVLFAQVGHLRNAWLPGRHLARQACVPGGLYPHRLSLRPQTCAAMESLAGLPFPP
jgi:hypothetical protein